MQKVAFVAGLAVSLLFAAVDRPVYLMPINCSELVPDSGPFMNFFDSVARGLAVSNRSLSRRLFRILSLRERVMNDTGRVGDVNPVDPLIRRFVCYYREQKNPTSIVSFDDTTFRQFVKKELDALEKQIDAAVNQVVIDEHTRKEYERKLKAQQNLVDSIKSEAEEEASLLFERAQTRARTRSP